MFCTYFHNCLWSTFVRCGLRLPRARPSLTNGDHRFSLNYSKSPRKSRPYDLKNPFHWTAIQLRSWRSRIFSKIIPNRRGRVGSHAIWGLGASSTLPLRFYYASATLLLRSHCDNEDLTTLSLRWWRCSCDLATTLATKQRFRCAFVSLLYRKWNSDTLLLRPVRFSCASTALLPCLLRLVYFWQKFRIIAESPSSGMGV